MARIFALVALLVCVQKLDAWYFGSRYGADDVPFFEHEVDHNSVAQQRESRRYPGDSTRFFDYSDPEDEEVGRGRSYILKRSLGVARHSQGRRLLSDILRDLVALKMLEADAGAGESSESSDDALEAQLARRFIF